MDVLMGKEGRQIILEHRIFGPCPALQNIGVQDSVGDKSQGNRERTG